jgi:hypothetical protein
MSIPTPGLTFLLLELAVIVLMLTGLAIQASPQQDLDTTPESIMPRVRRQYHLSKSDLKRLGPLIEHQNVSLLSSLQYDLDNDPHDFGYLWDIVRTHRNYSAAADSTLTPRQAHALIAARKLIEDELLDQWTEDYLTMLDETLDLDDRRSEYVRNVFEKEARGRRALLRARTQDREWESLTDTRERVLRQILTAGEWRTYRKLIDPSLMLIG